MKRIYFYRTARGSNSIDSYRTHTKEDGNLEWKLIPNGVKRITKKEAF